MTRVALQNEDFAHICSQPSMQVRFGAPPYERWLKNYNRLLTLYPDCIGVKTGFTDDAGRCLVSAAERDGMTLICVTLNAHAVADPRRRPAVCGDHRLFVEAAGYRGT